MKCALLTVTIPLTLGAVSTERSKRKNRLSGARESYRSCGGIRRVAQISEQLQYVDSSIENIYKEMGSHISRMTQLQRELDALRDRVRRLAEATST
jgi:peptidoglycan hydrolase CwlO-like protein